MHGLLLEQLAEVAELGVAHLGAGTVSGGNTVTAAVTPHGGNAVVLRTGGHHDGLGVDDVEGAVQNAVTDSAGDLAIVNQQVGDSNLVDDGDAQLLGHAAHTQGAVQVDTDHEGHGAGRDLDLGNGDAPAGHAVEHLIIHGYVLLHGVLIAQVAANGVHVVLQELLGLHVVQIKVLENAAALVGLTAVTGSLLFNHDDGCIGILFLGRNCCGQTGNTAANDQKVGSKSDFSESFHVGLLSHRYISKL